MPETPYCPLLSINKEVPVLCQEELCMWYVKQLKLCSITVLAYANALNIQGIQAPAQKPQAPSLKPQEEPKQATQAPPKKEQTKGVNPFMLDDLD